MLVERCHAENLASRYKIRTLLFRFDKHIKMDFENTDFIVGLSATDPLNELNSLERTRTRASHERERRMTADINSKRPYHRTYASPAR